jgi:hypothetical protein
MHKLVSTIVFSLSAFGLMFAGATIDHSEVSILGCQKGDACGAGNDGVQARGGRVSGTVDTPNGPVSFTNSGNEKAGHLTLSTPDGPGTASGTNRTKDGTPFSRGRFTGVVTQDGTTCTGKCDGEVF